jgi:hypothetical protein
LIDIGGALSDVWTWTVSRMGPGFGCFSFCLVILDLAHQCCGKTATDSMSLQFGWICSQSTKHFTLPLSIGANMPMSLALDSLRNFFFH